MAIKLQYLFEGSLYLTFRNAFFDCSHFCLLKYGDH